MNLKTHLPSDLSSFWDFWPYYLCEHRDPINRGFHIFGTLTSFSIIFLSAYLNNAWLLLALPILGYACAWTGHFFFEKNVPATMTYPRWSLRADILMTFFILTGQLPKQIAAAEDKLKHIYTA